VVSAEPIAVASDEALQRADILARLLRTSSSTADALSWWAGFPLRREPRAVDVEHTVDEHEALLLDLPAGAIVTRRDGYLAADLPSGATFRAAAVTALVREGALGLDLGGREALHRGIVPLGRLLRGGQRAVHYVQRVPGDIAADRPALRARATLVTAGKPVAVLDEVVYWRLLLRRAPGQIPPFLHPLSAPPVPRSAS
jgi:hypothetical protein